MRHSFRITRNPLEGAGKPCHMPTFQDSSHIEPLAMQNVSHLHRLLPSYLHGDARFRQAPNLSTSTPQCCQQKLQGNENIVHAEGVRDY
jgi:hypothetical protein